MNTLISRRKFKKQRLENLMEKLNNIDSDYIQPVKAVTFLEKKQLKSQKSKALQKKFEEVADAETPQCSQRGRPNLGLSEATQQLKYFIKILNMHFKAHKDRIYKTQGKEKGKAYLKLHFDEMGFQEDDLRRMKYNKDIFNRMEKETLKFVIDELNIEDRALLSFTL